MLSRPWRAISPVCGVLSSGTVTSSTYEVGRNRHNSELPVPLLDVAFARCMSVGVSMADDGNGFRGLTYFG